MGVVFVLTVRTCHNRYKKMREGSWEFTPLPGAKPGPAGKDADKNEKPKEEEATVKEQYSLGDGVGSVSGSKQQIEHSKLGKMKGKGKGKGGKSATVAITGEDRGWASRRHVYEKRTFEKKTATSPLPNTTATATSSPIAPTTTVPAAASPTSPSADTTATRGHTYSRLNLRRHHMSMLTLGRHVTAGKKRERPRKALDLEEGTPGKRAGNSLHDFMLMFSHLESSMSPTKPEPEAKSLDGESGKRKKKEENEDTL